VNENFSTGAPSPASGPPRMRFLVSLTVVPVIANIVITATAETVAACLPLSRRAINRTSLQTNGTRSVVSEDN
jgi:hypothetical protein